MEGSSAKLEVVRGVSKAFAFMPRSEGVALEASSPSVALSEPGGGALAAPTATVAADGSITWAWTPGDTLQLAEDYYADISYSAGGQARKERLYFDLVLHSLECPVEEGHLTAREPALKAALTAAGLSDPRVQIAAAWDEARARIRGQGFRPGLVTDRHAFAPFVVARALELTFRAAIKSPEDTADRKRGLYADEADRAWDLLGPLKFESTAGQYGVVGKASSLPRFRI